MDESRFNHLKAELETLSSGSWKDLPVCPDLGLQYMDDNHLSEFLRVFRPTFIDFGSTKWSNFINALLYLNVDQRIMDTIAEEFPGMDRALEESVQDEQALYKKKNLDLIKNISYFPGVTAADATIFDEGDFEEESDEDDEEYQKFFLKLKNGPHPEAEHLEVERPKPSPVLKETVEAINTARRLLKMAEQNIQNVAIVEARPKPSDARRYFDDYGNHCENRSEQRIKRGIRNALYSADKMIDLLSCITCREEKDWIRHSSTQRGNAWMIKLSGFNNANDRPTQAKGRKAYKRIPAEVKKAEKFLKTASGDSEADNK